MSLLSVGLTGLSHATPIFLVAAAITLVFDANRVLDLSQAAIAGLAAALFGRLALAPTLALVAIPAVLAVGGGAVELLVIHRLRRAPLLAQLLVTLGLFLVFQDAARLLWADSPATSPGWAIGQLGTLAIVGAAPAILGLLLTVRARGRLIVPLAAALSGLAGTLWFLSQPTHSVGFDTDLLADSLLTVLLGGLGSLPGAFIAAIVIALLRAFTADLFPSSALALPLALTAAFLLVRPGGLFTHANPAPLHQAPTMLIRPASRSAKLLFAAAFLMGSVAICSASSGMPLFANIGIAVLLAASLHLLLGPGGMPSLGHAAFFGVGAYAAALFVRTAGIAPSLSLLGAALVFGTLTAGLAALVVGTVVARLSAPALAMLTLVIAYLASTVATWISPIESLAWADMVRISAPLTVWLTFAVCVGIALLLRRLLYAPFGYALRAARDNPARAAAIGLPIPLLRLTAFTIAGGTAGLAGALTLVTVGAAPVIHRSADTLLMLALGGVQTIAAPFVGALAYTGAAQMLAPWPFLLGPALIAVPLLLPEGIAGASIRLWRRPA
ncbi:MAG: ABC transporter permease subunit [Janthinobacterium lividum]